MVFSSFLFLCFFLTATLVLHTLIPKQGVRNALLTVASLCFYAFGEPVYVGLLLLSVAVNYAAGRLVGREETTERARKLTIGATVLVNLGLLFVFKYTGFFVESLNAVLPEAMQLTVPHIRLPIGISFFTFQALSYVIDVYRKDVKVQKSFFQLLLYISFFPQLIAGPIVKYRDVADQIANRTVTAVGIKHGIYRFSVGLGKKALIANGLAYVADQMFQIPNRELGLLAGWMGALTYLGQIYFDFSGYSDMAIGLGRMFGFRFLENFNYPYIATSVQEFWRRWHISLSTWFRLYLYIPLGGNRKGNRRAMFNRFLVFLATGIWHGANWTFLLWGVYHGLLLTLEKCGLLRLDGPKCKPLKWLYTILMVTIGFVLFRADNLTQAFSMIGAMFGLGAAGGSGFALAFRWLRPYQLVLFVIAILGATPLPAKLARLLAGDRAPGLLNRERELPLWLDVAAMLGCMLILLLTFMSLAADSYNPFIYFRF